MKVMISRSRVVPLATVAAMLLAVAAPQFAEAQKKGMTWSVLQTKPTNGTVRVGCKVGCDPYKGDTPCTTPLRLLCVRKSGAGFPLPPPPTFNNSDRYNKWVGGIIGTTKAMAPPALLAGANKACVAEFGPDWRVAEFHDGWGWAFWGYGAFGNPTQRARVHINDQNANCWK
ncbi:MAG TPA: flagellar hook-length control protein [Thermoanaerobaculia bacterium]|nr:flagellar hook-length control protein [Thermoanaerobaculia bacterium]